MTLSGYRMAWIGYADSGTEKLVLPAAYAGFEEGYLHSAKITWADTPRGRGPVGVAIRTGRPAVITHVRTDSAFSLWREDAIHRGYESSSAFPMLSDSGQPFGALALYASEADAFQAEEVQVVAHLVHLVAYGVLSIRSARQEHRDLTNSIDTAAELHAVLDNMLESVFVCDLEGHIVLANPAGLQLLGTPTIEDARKYSWASAYGFLPRKHDGVETNELCPLERTLKGEVVTHFRERLYPPGKPAIVATTTAAPIWNSSGQIVGAVKVVRDVTDLVEFEKMKDEFVEVAAHELKTPVTAIKGYCQLLLRHYEPFSRRARDLLTEIDLGAIRIDRIVKDLLDLSQLHYNELLIHKDVFDLGELLSKLVLEASIRSPEHHIFISNLSPAVVNADRERISQVVRILIENAIKYSPRGGDVEIQQVISDREVVVSVRDEGVGIPQLSQMGLFQRFYRGHVNTPYEYGGLGVGLYLSKEIVQRHHGRIWFESLENRGSTFKFSLPLDEKDLEDERGKSRNST